jgi:hypothetical protein
MYASDFLEQTGYKANYSKDGACCTVFYFLTSELKSNLGKIIGPAETHLYSIPYSS